MQQRCFDFDQSPQAQQTHIAEVTSLSPLPLVRPDRQITFNGLSPYEWPTPAPDRDTITVDRIHEDIDGPSHRFMICRGDTVEAFVGPERTAIGEVTGISHQNQEVRVAFSQASEGIWLNVGCIYPSAAERPQHATANNASRGESRVEVGNMPEGAFTESDRVPCPLPAYTFDEYQAFRREFSNGSLSLGAYQTHFERLCQSQAAIAGELKSRFTAKELAVIASRMGSLDAKRSTKEQNAESIYRRMLASFVLDGTVSYTLGERYEDAVQRKVEAVTREDYEQAFADRAAKVAAHSKALADPETFFEFRTFLQEKSESDLSDEQLARYDALHADMTRERRAAQVKTTVEQFKSEELGQISFQIKEGYHDKRSCPVWIVQLSTRVQRASFDELNRKAKMLGGWYSSFKKADAGFQFLDEERAKRFTALLSGNADRSDVLESRKERRELSAAERLHELASELARRADEAIARSEASLQNTARRAGIQAGVRGRAFADQALARAMHAIAEALSRGEAKYLDAIRYKTQFEALESVLYLAKWARIRALRTCFENQYS